MKQKVHSSFIDNIWGANLANIANMHELFLYKIKKKNYNY